MFSIINLITYIILLSSLSLVDKVVTNRLLIVLATIIVSILASLVPTFRFNTSFPKILITNKYLKFYK